MNNWQKERIAYLRRSGKSYSKIAKALGISVNTVKSFCRRNNLGKGAALELEPPESGAFCRQCQAPLVQVAVRKQKLFCSDRCRMLWWNDHPEKMNRKAVRRFTCRTCGKVFEAYGKRERKYCSRACYGRSRAVRP